MPKIRLRRGEELVEVGDRKLLLGMASLEDVLPDASVVIEVHPQLAGVVATLLVDRPTAESFDLLDIRVGRNSQFVSTSPIPLSSYAVDVEGYPEMGEIAMAEEKYRELFDLDLVPVGMNLTFMVHNKSKAPLRFRGWALFHCKG